MIKVLVLEEEYFLKGIHIVVITIMGYLRPPQLSHVCQDNMCFKTTFVLVKNLTDKAILGNPFLCSLYPFTVDSKGITTQPFGQTIKFRFTSEPIPRNISTIQAGTVSDLISAKTIHLKYLQEEIRYKKVEDQLACKIL